MIIFNEHNQRKQAEAQLQIRLRQQATLAQLGQLALTGGDLTTLFERAVELTAQMLQVEYCKVLELLPGGKALLLRAGVGWQEGLVGQAMVNTGRDSQAGYTLLTHKPVIVEDLRAETRFSDPPLLDEHGVVSGMSVLILGKEQPFGILGAHTAQRRTFTEDDIHFLQGVANVLAETIQRHKLAQILRAGENQLALIFNTVSDALFLLAVEANHTYRFVSVNRKFLTLTGLAEEQVVGKRLEAVIPQPAHALVRSKYREAIRAKKTDLGRSVRLPRQYADRSGCRYPGL